jgi:hypothetical protein
MMNTEWNGRKAVYSSQCDICLALHHWFSVCSNWLLEKLTGHSNSQENICGTWKFITMFTTACHQSLPQARRIQSIPTNLILILFFYLCLGLPSCLLPSGFPTKILYVFLIFPIHIICPTHLILLNLVPQLIFLLVIH